MGLRITPQYLHRCGRRILSKYLADFMVREMEEGLEGPYNLVSEMGMVTGEKAELVWKTPREITEAGIRPWSEWPLWIDSESDS